MNYKLGLKLFSSNLSSIKKAQEYYSQGLFDYLELMAIPGTYGTTIKYWKKLDLPFIMHAPHGKYGFNLSISKLYRKNAKLFCETQKFADDLGAKDIIIHPGLMGKVEETIRQINRIGDKRIVIENNPFMSLFQTKCVGHSPEEIKSIIDKTGIDFCLDIVHLVKAAYVNGWDYFKYFKRFLLLKPKIIHICDCQIKGCFDEHLNLGRGELDFKNILDYILKKANKMFLTLEVPEKSYKELKGFKKDSLFMKKILRRVYK